MDHEVALIDEDWGEEAYPAPVHFSGLFVDGRFFALLARLKALHQTRYQAFCHIVRAIAEEMEAQNGLRA